jgi:hypothetical protein
MNAGARMTNKFPPVSFRLRLSSARDGDGGITKIAHLHFIHLGREELRPAGLQRLDLDLARGSRLPTTAPGERR